MSTTSRLLIAGCCLAAVSLQAQRRLQPDDLFQVRQVGAVAWSPDGLYAAIEISRPRAALNSVPTNELVIVDSASGTVRMLTPSAGELGFFNPVWSPEGHKLAFLSVDSSAVVRPWIWSAGATSPDALADLDIRTGFGESPVAWIGPDRIVCVAWDIGAQKSGDLYFQILRGRNVAEGWKRAVDGQVPTVSVLESGAVPAAVPTARLVSVDLASGARRTLASGDIHRLRISSDGRFAAFLRDVKGQPVASYFAGTSDSDAIYDPVNWGTEAHVIDVQTGEEAPSTRMVAPSKAAATPINAVLPLPEARRLSSSPGGAAALYLAYSSDGAHLWLAGGSGRPLSSYREIWKGNRWCAEIRFGKAEPFSYTSSDGVPLTAWLVLPPDYEPGVKVPLVTVVYPSAYNSTLPWNLSLGRSDFDDPQLLAALGYAVLLPSMPSPKNPADAHIPALLGSGVFPAIDALVARGIVDPDRVALMGQSDGAFATVALLTETTRFRSAIASAGFSDLASLYGTFYGQDRYGDYAPPEKGQLLRMLQMEKGLFAFGGPPWQQFDRYRDSSPIQHVAKIQTPLMLVHGDMDFVPIQQDEELFTALYRQDKRVRFVRYQGEWHTIASRANVLDLWQRIAAWLSETMAPKTNPAN